MAGKWKGVPIDYGTMVRRLRSFQKECEKQHLGVECELATIMMSIIDHSKDDWTHFSPERFKKHLRKLQRALECDESTV
jgi:hypothetical protein